MSAAARACSPSSGPTSWAAGGSWGSTWTTRSSRPSGRSGGGRTWSIGSRTRRTCRSRTVSSTWRPRSRCSSTCPIRSAPLPRWRASQSGRCSSRCRASRSGAGSTWLAAPISRISATRRVTSTTGPSGASSRCSRSTERSTRSARRSRGRWCLSASADDTQARSYGRGAAILGAGVGVTGLITYAYFALASHSLSKEDYGRISLLWSTVFIVVSVLYRPVEQLLSRTIADRAARGQSGGEHLRVAATIQLGLGALFLVLALVFRQQIEDQLFDNRNTLYYVMVVAVLCYAASYFARGYLAGSRMFGLYGGLVFIESVARCMFALVVALGIAHGENVTAMGIAAAPLLSLAGVPWALGGHIRSRSEMTSDEVVQEAAALDAAGGEQGGEPEFTLSHGAGFAVAVLLIMLCEQAIYNAGPLLIKGTESPAAEATALAGFAFNVMLIARAPLQLFQAIQTSILPHLTTLRATGETDPFRRSIQLTLMAIALFAGGVALAMLVLGPTIMRLAFGGNFHYPRGGLVMVAAGMGFYLSAATLNQAALAHAQAKQAAAVWAIAAVAFVVWLLLPGFDDRVLQLEAGYLGAAGLLCALLYGLYRRSVSA